MIETLPAYISITFILTTFLAVGCLFYAIRTSVFETAPAKLAGFLIGFWIFFQAVLALSGFHEASQSTPPRIVSFGVLPALVVIAAYFVFFRRRFVEKLPLKVLTLLHVVRVPVEIVLLWLFQNRLIPQSMTFEGRNFDILSGLTAPLVLLLAFRGGRVNRALLIGWNLAALALLFNVVDTAILSFPFPGQTAPVEETNRAVLYFPYVWLPTIVVPIVFFAHLASLWKLSTGKVD